MPAGGGRLLAALVLLALAAPAAAVEVCKVVDLQLVTQTGEFFLAGIARALVLPAHARVLSCAPAPGREPRLRGRAAAGACAARGSAPPMIVLVHGELTCGLAVFSARALPPPPGCGAQ